MEEHAQVGTDISPEQWLAEARALSAKAGEKGFYVRILFLPHALVSTSGYQLQADEQEICLRLRPQSPSDSGNDDICVSLPRLEEGVYRKSAGDDGETFLLLAWRPCGMDIPAMLELQIATSREFVDFVTNVAPTQ